MAEQKDRLKYEIVTELRAGQLRWYRNVAALGGLALLIGCTVALNPLIGGIVAGTIMLAGGIAAMVLSHRAQSTGAKKKEERET